MTTINPNLPPNHGQPAAPTVTPPLHYTDGFGIASIIMAAMFFTVPGLILGIIGESKAKSRNASPILSRIGWITNLVMLVISLVIAVALFTFLVQHSDEIKTEFNKQAASNSMQQTFSADTFHVHAPNSFSDSRGDNPDAAVSIGNDATNVYLLAYSDNVSDIADGTTLTQYADKAFEAFTQDTSFSGQKREQLAPGTVTNPNNLEVIDYKMEANYGINKYVYYDRYIKTTGGFYMLTTWTTPGRLDANLPTMKAILASFEETTSPTR